MPGAPGAASQRDLVLVGGGHAHVQVLRRFMMKPVEGVRLTVVLDRYEAVYSGMVPGLVAADYTPDQLTIDVLPLARRAGARCILAAATRIDPDARRIELSGRPAIAYDVASLDVGSSVRDLDVSGVREHAVATRPIGQFVRDIEDRLAACAPSERVHALVVGGGAAGVELALCLDARMRGERRTGRVTLVASSESLLPGAQAHLARRVEAEAAARGLEIHLGHRVASVDADAVVVEAPDGTLSRLPSNLTLWATGAAPVAMIGASKLPLTPEGFVRVDRHLEVPGCPDLFAVGDCAVPDAAPWIPRAGVYAVRQGPVLDANLRARLAGRPPRPYRPQRDFLALLNLGGRRAIGGKWGLGADGKAVFWLKDWIDQRFMKRFQVLTPSGRPAEDFPSPDSMPDEGEMSCGGCAAKVGPSPLRTALSRLDAAPPDESVRLGIDDADDAAAVVLSGGDVLLATVDAFRAFTDDPWLVGRTAAVNAVSDVYAKGGQPRHALAIVTVPDGTASQQSETLHQVLAGIRAALDPLAVSLVGGHSTTGSELFVGLSITGRPMQGDLILGLDGLRDGDQLILTKPLGSGVLLAADMRGLASGQWMEALTDGLLRDNTAAARCAIDHNVDTCTDVSGFGLAGHLHEMLVSSGASAELVASQIPAYVGALSLLRDGLRSTYHEQNAGDRTWLRANPHVDETVRELLFDPQTSGGLLMGVRPDRASGLLSDLRAHGDAHAQVIGTVGSRADGVSAITLGVADFAPGLA